MAQIYEGNLQREVNELEKQLSRGEEFHPALSLNSPRDRSYAMFAAALILSAAAVAGTASASHSGHGITPGEGEILQTNFTAGYDGKVGTVDDKILLTVDDRFSYASNGYFYKSKGVHEFRIESDIKENLTALSQALEPGKWLQFKHQGETHGIVQVDKILPPDYTQSRKAEEAIAEAGVAQNTKYVMYGAPPVILAIAGALYWTWKNDKKKKEGEESI